MSEKRFKLYISVDDEGIYIVDNENVAFVVRDELGDWATYKLEKIVALLNSLAEENEQLRQINENYINIINRKIQELEETNVVMLLPRESVQVLNSLKKELLDDE